MKRAAGALAAAMMLMAATEAAMADSRLFSISTDTPGVTVTSAARNGASLPVAGGDGAVTFFRIENPAGAVPCVSSMSFTLSSGANVTRSIDFCAQDWDVVLALSPPAPPQPQPPASGNAVVTTDDPSAVIVGVFVGGSTVPLQSAAGRSVGIAASALQGGQGCARDMGVELSDGRRMARNVNICVGNGPIVVALSDRSPVAPPAQPGPVNPPPFPAFPQAGAQPPVVTPPVPQTEVVNDMTWQSDSGGGRATLTYGIPQTGAGEFTAVCDMRSSAATVVLTRTPPGLAVGGSANVRFEAGGFSGTYRATGADFGTGVAYPRIDLATDDPLWGAIIRGNVLLVTAGSAPTYGLGLKGSAAATRPFLQDCDPLPVGPPQAPPQQPGPVSFFCDDGQAFTAVFDNRNGLVSVFSGPGAPLLLNRVSAGRFAGSGAELIGRDETITWLAPGRAPTACRQS